MTETKKRSFLSSHDEVGNIRTFVFDADDHSWIAGQSQAYVLPQAGKSEEAHQRWFTIASAPSEGVMHISTRISQSAFKQALNALRPGDMVETYDLSGDFTWEQEPSDPVVLVAGGIGVTPFRSILLERAARGKQLNATLLLFSRTDEIPFRDTLETLAQAHSAFTFVPVIGQPISAESILAYAPQATTQLVYLSGAEPMVQSVSAQLETRGIAVKQDQFPGYDEKNY
jgi:ferredoxin-NADP reductase